MDNGQRTIENATDDESVVNKPNIATSSQILKILELSPAKTQEIEREQARLKRLANSRARLNPDERARARGAELEAHYLTTKNRDGLAEARAMQGRYRDAAKIAKRKSLKARYEELARAVQSKDDFCKCELFSETESGLKLPLQTAEFYGYSTKHKKQVPFYRCAKCGRLNAREPVPELQAARIARAESIRQGYESVKAEEFFKAE